MSPVPTHFNLVNFAAFQVTWFASVLGAAAGVDWAGPACVAAWLTLHLRAQGVAWRGEAALLAGAGVLGFTMDSALVQAGVLRFHDAGLFAPAWMTALWLALAATLRHSLAWLAGRPVLAALLGLVGGPAAYLAGERLGALAVADGMAALLLIALSWALAMPVVLRAASAVPAAAGARP